MTQFRLNRRAVLRGAGGVAIGLPWLEVMQAERSALAAPAPAKRFLAVFTPGGTVLDNWRPSGTEDAFAYGPILRPLEPVKSRVLVVDGLDMKSAVGEQNQSGIVAWLTGTPQAATTPGFATGPSLDQYLASRNPGALRSLEVAVRWGTGKSHGVPHPINIANYADDANFTPIAPRLDPMKIWSELFGAPPEPALSARQQSILDAVEKRYAKLAQRVGSADRQVLEAHLTRIRELEQALQRSTGTCAGPPLIDTSTYDPQAGLHSDDSGSVRDVQTDAAIPSVGKLMMDMLVMALSCDLTSVATLLWSDTEAKHTFPWLGLNEHLHFYMNDGGYHPEELTAIFTWYAEQHAYLIDQLANAPGPNGSLLDDTVVFFGSQLQNPATHAKSDMPFLLAGNGGGLRPGRFVRYAHQSHNDLLVSIANLFGAGRQAFGAAEYCQGPLGGLT